MSDFSTTTLDQSILDPRKRVRYTTGLVLGVDEFQQEQDYLMERDKRHQRGLHGYGTVNGLDVQVRLRDGEPEVLVTSGYAVDRLGRDVCVTSPQCAPLNGWLAANADAVREILGSPPDALPLYVVLCYRDCATDFVPIPGSPCRSDDDAMAASRLADSFELRLELEAPTATEERVIRTFGVLLGRLRITDDEPGLTAAELGDLVRALPEVEDLDPFAPILPIASAEASDLLRHAFRVWATEVRPTLGGEGGCMPPTEACLLLARLEVGLEEAGDLLVVAADLDGPDVTVDQDVRPLLMSTRLLQEWLARLDARSEDSPGSFSFPGDDALLALNDLIDVETAPAPGDVLTWDGASWGSGPVAGGTTDHGALVGLADDDHPQYHTDARGDARYALLGHNHSLPALTDLDAGGDLDGLYPNPTVVALQGRPVAATAPAGANPVLRWNGAQWAPFDLALAPANETTAETGLVRIVATSWTTGASSPLSVVLDGLTISGVVVAFGFDELRDGGTVQVGAGSLDPNSFQLFVEVGDRTNAELYTYQGLRPAQRGASRQIVPVRLINTVERPWQVGLQAGSAPAEAALFPVSDAALEGLPQGARLRVIIHGDHVLAADGRALDAEAARGDLPTGDRPASNLAGNQGGRFESWFTFGSGGQLPPILIDINRATLEEILTLPGVGPVTADRILTARAAGGRFSSMDDLARAGRIPAGIAASIADRVRFGN